MPDVQQVCSAVRRSLGACPHPSALADWAYGALSSAGRSVSRQIVRFWSSVSVVKIEVLMVYAGHCCRGERPHRARDAQSQPAHPHLSRKLTRLCTISRNHGSRCSRTLTSAKVRYLSPHAITTALRSTLTYRQMGRSTRSGASVSPAPSVRATHFRRSAKSQPTSRGRTMQKMVGLPTSDR